MKDDVALVEELASSDASVPPPIAMEPGLQSVSQEEQVMKDFVVALVCFDKLVGSLRLGC